MAGNVEIHVVDSKILPERLTSTHNNPYSITQEILEQRLRKPQYGRIWTQVYMGFLACLSSLSFGTTLGWAYTVSTDMANRCDIHPNIAWLISITLLGCSIGITLTNFLIKQMGPKRVICILGPFFILTWWLMLIADLQLQLAGRFFLGFLGITHATASEILLNQTVHYALRKYMVVLQSCTMNVGILVIRLVAAATTQYWATVVCAIMPIAHYVLVSIVPESPVFLYRVSQQEAARSLTWYRGKGNFHVDMECIKKDWDTVRLDSEAYRYMMFSKAVYRGVFVVLVLTVFQVAAGYFTFLFYSITVWGEGIIVVNKVTDAAVIGTCFVLTKLFWGYLHVFNAHWKIRGFLISSCFCCSFMLALIGIYLILRHHKIWSTANWLPLVFVCFFFFFYDMGLNQFPRILTFEYMPVQVFKKVDSITQGVFWGLAFFNIYIFALSYLNFYPHYIIMSFASLTFLGGIFCNFFVVEPRGKSLIQIQLAFGGNPIGTRGALFRQIHHTF